MEGDVSAWQAEAMDITGTMSQHNSQTAEGVCDRLMASSSRFAQSAVAAYSGESWEVFYLHLATSVEQLVKAVPARAHPSLIADARADFDSLLHLCGLGGHAKTPEFVKAVRTVPVAEALKRVERLVDEYRPPPPRVRFLLDLRNAIVHAGHREKGEAEAVLGETARYVEQLLENLGLAEADYWGDVATFVSEHAKRRLSEREAAYTRRLQAARDRYAKLVGPLSPVALEALIAAATPSAPRETFDSATAVCPACGHQGELTGFPDPVWEPDVDYADGETYFVGAHVGSIRLLADGFRCPICGLNIDLWELPFAGLERTTLTPKDYDVAAATRFFERELADEDGEEG